MKSVLPVSNFLCIISEFTASDTQPDYSTHPESSTTLKLLTWEVNNIDRSVLLGNLGAWYSHWCHLDPVVDQVQLPTQNTVTQNWSGTVKGTWRRPQGVDLSSSPDSLISLSFFFCWMCQKSDLLELQLVSPWTPQDSSSCPVCPWSRRVKSPFWDLSQFPRSDKDLGKLGGQVDARKGEQKWRYHKNPSWPFLLF